MRRASFGLESLNRLVLAVLKTNNDPNSMYGQTVSIMRTAGMDVVKPKSRRPRGTLVEGGTTDVVADIRFQRQGDALKNLGEGLIHCAILGRDKLREYQLATGDQGEIREVAQLGFGQCTMVMAVDGNSDIQTVADLEDKVIMTSYPAILKDYLARNGITVKDENIRVREGGIEDYIEEGVADAVMDITETGSTIKEYGLRVIDDEIVHSEICFVASKRALDLCGQEIADLATRTEVAAKQEVTPVMLVVQSAQGPAVQELKIKG